MAWMRAGRRQGVRGAWGSAFWARRHRTPCNQALGPSLGPSLGPRGLAGRLPPRRHPRVALAPWHRGDVRNIFWQAAGPSSAFFSVRWAKGLEKVPGSLAAPRRAGPRAGAAREVQTHGGAGRAGWGGGPGGAGHPGHRRGSVNRSAREPLAERMAHTMLDRGGTPPSDRKPRLNQRCGVRLPRQNGPLWGPGLGPASARAASRR